MLTITPISKAVAIAEAERYPTLTGNGFNYEKFTRGPYSKADRREDRRYLWSDDGLLQIAFTMKWALEHRVSPSVGSYSIKHRVEDWSGAQGRYKYISNGCSILGLSLSGYDVKIEEDGPNCFFEVRRQR